MVLVDSQMVHLVLVWHFIAINVFPEIRRASPVSILAETVEPGFSVFSPRKDEFCMRKFLINSYIKYLPGLENNIYQSVLLSCGCGILFQRKPGLSVV